jgi:predicted dehydrogenase
MSQRRVRVGLSGAGSMGANHARVLSRMRAECELIGIYDVDAERASALAAEWGVPVLTSFASLIQRSDAVVVAASTGVHVEQVLSCVDAGRPVLVEKPVAPDLEATLALRDAVARTHGAIVQAGHIEHFNPCVAGLRRVLDGDVPLAVSARRLGPRALRDDVTDVVSDLMLHDIHVAVVLGAGTLTDASAVALGVPGGPTHHAHATLRFDTGMVADLTASRITPARVRFLEATTLDAHITADYVTGAVQVARWDAPNRGNIITAVPVSTDEPLERELRAFLAAAGGVAPVEVSLDDAVACMQVVEAVRASAEGPGLGELERAERWLANAASR